MDVDFREYKHNLVTRALSACGIYPFFSDPHDEASCCGLILGRLAIIMIVHTKQSSIPRISIERIRDA